MRYSNTLYYLNEKHIICLKLYTVVIFEQTTNAYKYLFKEGGRIINLKSFESKNRFVKKYFFFASKDNNCNVIDTNIILIVRCIRNTGTKISSKISVKLFVCRHPLNNMLGIRKIVMCNKIIFF